MNIDRGFCLLFLLSQQLTTTLLIHFGRRMGYTKARPVDMSTARKLLPISLFYNANVAFAMASLKGVNIPMYIAIKRLTPLAVLIAGFFSGKGRPTTQVCVAFVWIIIVSISLFSFIFYACEISLEFMRFFFHCM